MTKPIDNINQIIKAESLPPVLIMFGEEDFLLEEAYNKLIKYLLKGKTSEFDFEVLNGEDITADRVVDSCVAFPFVSEKRVVVVKHFEKLTAGSKKKDDKNPILRYLASPQPTTFLLLVSEAENLNGLSAALKNAKQQDKANKIINNAHPIYKNIIENFAWVEFPKVYESDFPAWVVKRFKEKGKDISAEAVELLVRQTNPTLRDINNEIEKLVLYVQDKPAVTIDDVTFIAGTSRVYNVFELQKAIGKRDLAACLDIMENMLRAERQEMLIMTMLTRYFITLWKLLEESARTTNQFQLASAAGVSPYFVPEYLDAVRQYRPSELDRAFFALTEADEQLKSSSTDSLFVLQNMFIKIMEN